MEERLKRWCSLSDVPYPGNRIFVGQNRIDDEGPSSGTASQTGTLNQGSTTTTPVSTIGPTSVSSASAVSALANLLEAKKWKKKLLTPEKVAQHELAREAVQCIEFLMPTEFLLKPDDFVLGTLLLHYDLDIATATSHTLQAIVLRNPDLRVPIIRQVLQLILHYTSCTAPLYAPSIAAEENNTHVLLTELLALLDLWALATFHEQLPTAQSLTNYSSTSAPPVPRKQYWTTSQAASLLDEIEAFALVSLCDAVPFVRSSALSILGAIEAIREQFSLLDHNRGYVSPIYCYFHQTYSILITPSLTWLIRAHGTSIMQKVRYDYVLDAAQGMADQVTIVRVLSCFASQIESSVLLTSLAALFQPSDKILLKIEQCATSSQDVLWSYIISQLAYTLIDNQEVMGPGSSNVLRIARAILLHRVETWRSIAQSNGQFSATTPPSLTFAVVATSANSLSGSAFAFSSTPANVFQVAQFSSEAVHANLPALYRNVHTLFFSMSASVPAQNVPVTFNFDEAAAQASMKLDEATKAEEYGIQNSLASYLAYYFRVCSSQNTYTHQLN